MNCDVEQKRKIDEVRSPERSKFKLRVVLSDINEDTRGLADRSSTRLVTGSETNLINLSSINPLSTVSDEIADLSTDDYSFVDAVMSMNRTYQITDEYYKGEEQVREEFPTVIPNLDTAEGNMTPTLNTDTPTEDTAINLVPRTGGGGTHFVWLYGYVLL